MTLRQAQGERKKKLKLLTLRIYQARHPVKFIKLKHPSFHISHFIEDETHKIKDTISMVEAPRFKKAKELAEWCYREWLEINHKS